MPGSWPYLRNPIKKYLTDNFSSESKILDIGAGEGTYYNLLSDHFSMFDAIEIWTPYIQQYDLNQKYRNVFNVNIMDFVFGKDEYDIIIMGDILEHLSREHAKQLVPYLFERCKELIVVVPFNLPQDEVFGNQYEKHLQADLNHIIMETEYPLLKMLMVQDFPNKNQIFKCEIPIDVASERYHLCAYVKNI